MDLSREQKAAVESTASRTLVVAGAGTGKTRILTQRVQWVLDQEYSPSSLFVGTYTRKASGEMRDRLVSQGLKLDDLWLGTVHSLLWKMVGMFLKELNFPSPPSLFGQQDQESLSSWMVEELKLKSSPRGLSTARRLPLAERVSLSRDMKDFLKHYEASLVGWNALDYDGLIDIGYSLARLKSCRSWIDHRFHAVVLDEGQDIPSSQWAVLEGLFPTQDWFVVASSPQQIMSFAGVRRPDLIRYAETALVFELEECFRCSAPILDTANAQLASSTDSLNPVGRSSKTGDEPIRKWFEDAAAESAWIVGEIQGLLSQDVPLQNIVVLARTNALVQEVADALFTAQIPAQAIGRHDAFASPLAHLVISLLRSAVNRKDEWSFWMSARLVSVPKADRARVKGLELRTGQSAWDAVGSWSRTAGRGTPLDKLVKVIQEMNRWLPDVQSASQAVEGTIKLIRSAFPRFDAPVIQRVALEREVGKLTALCGGLTVASFLGWLGGRASIDLYDPVKEAVTVMTCHAAKGLEWPVVFLVGLEDGAFPTSGSQRNPEEAAEEGRICYTAMTRAISRLYLSGAATRQSFGRTVQRGPSPFLGVTHGEIPLAPDRQEQGISA